MIFAPTPLVGSYEISLEPRADNRGWFARYFCKEEFSQIGHIKEWVQMNHSFTTKKGTVRGMHFQHAPFAEIKLVRCISGSVFDVIIDLRKDSQTFLQWYGTELSAGNKRMLYIPAGFAHGFQTLENDSELLYHHSEYYMPAGEAGIRYNDHRINVQWPLTISEISERDGGHALLSEQFKGI